LTHEYSSLTSAMGIETDMPVRSSMVHSSIKNGFSSSEESETISILKIALSAAIHTVPIPAQTIQPAAGDINLTQQQAINQGEYPECQSRIWLI
jgi:hypothetical protein